MIEMTTIYLLCVVLVAGFLPEKAASAANQAVQSWISRKPISNANVTVAVMIYIEHEEDWLLSAGPTIRSGKAFNALFLLRACSESTWTHRNPSAAKYDYGRPRSHQQ